MVRLIDAHCHLHHCHLPGERLEDRLVDALVDRARKAGVEKIVCCGISEPDWDAVVRLHERYPAFIIPSFGLHPWCVGERSSEWFNRLEKIVREIPSGVGEIGLDFALTEYDRQEQSDVFAAQLALARQYKRPVSIHCRKAWDRLLDVLEHAGRLSQGGIVHSYSGTPEMFSKLKALGLSCSFSGSITHPRNKRGARALQAVPLAHLLVETDCPDMPPAEIDGCMTEPAHLVLVVRSIAAQLSRTEDEIARITAENAARIFGSIGKES